MSFPQRGRPRSHLSLCVCPLFPMRAGRCVATPSRLSAPSATACVCLALSHTPGLGARCTVGTGVTGEPVLKLPPSQAPGGAGAKAPTQTGWSGSEGSPALHAGPVAAVGPRGYSLSDRFGPSWGPVLTLGPACRRWCCGMGLPRRPRRARPAEAAFAGTLLQTLGSHDGTDRVLAV